MWTFQNFSAIDFSFILFSLEKIFGMIWICWNLLTLILWPNMLSVLENVPYVLENNVYPVDVGWNVLYVFQSCSIMLLRYTVSLLIAYMIYLLLGVRYSSTPLLLYCYLFLLLVVLILSLYIYSSVWCRKFMNVLSS